MRPRFSVVIPAHDRAEVVGRAVASVLAQTFANLEVVVVDRGSTDDTVGAVRAVADRRVRILTEPGDPGTARTAGVDAADGLWVAVLHPDDEVAPGWLARLGRLIDATDAELISCGGEQRHRDGSLSRIIPAELPGCDGVRACFRSGAFAVTRRLLIEVGAFGGPFATARPDEVGARMVAAALAHRRPVVHTPEPLVRWNEPVDEPAPTGDALRLQCSLQGIDALSRTPIPDGSLLTRYAVEGGVAAARLRRRDEARRLFRLARRLEPAVPGHWVRCLTASVPPVADRVWGEGLHPRGTSEMTEAVLR